MRGRSAGGCPLLPQVWEAPVRGGCRASSGAGCARCCCARSSGHPDSTAKGHFLPGHARRGRHGKCRRDGVPGLNGGWRPASGVYADLAARSLADCRVHRPGRVSATNPHSFNYRRRRASRLDDGRLVLSWWRDHRHPDDAGALLAFGLRRPASTTIESAVRADQDSDAARSGDQFAHECAAYVSAGNSLAGGWRHDWRALLEQVRTNKPTE
jgi:hypothetical protein